MWSAHHRKFEEKSCLWRERILQFESANSAKENWRYRFFQKKDHCFDNMQIYPADHRQRYVNINKRCYVYLWSCLFSVVSPGKVNEWAESYFLTEYLSEKEQINRLVVESSLIKVSQVSKYDSRRSWSSNLFSSGKASRKFVVNALPASNINS